MIKMVPHFATSDGKVHASLDGAVAHERRSMVTALLLSVRDGFGLALGQIDQTADVICGNGDDLVKVLTADLKRGLHNGGVVTSLPSTRVGERPSETIMRRESPAVLKAKDADGAVIYIGDAVTLISEAPADREKWGEFTERRVRGIEPDGSLLFDDKQWKWRGESLRKAKAA